MEVDPIQSVPMLTGLTTGVIAPSPSMNFSATLHLGRGVRGNRGSGSEDRRTGEVATADVAEFLFCCSCCCCNENSSLMSSRRRLKLSSAADKDDSNSVCMPSRDSCNFSSACRSFSFSLCTPVCAFN